MNAASRRTAILQYLLLYIMIIMHGAVIWVAFVDDSYPSIIAVALLLIWVIVAYRVKIPLSFYFFCLATFACYLLSALINGLGFSTGLNIKTALIVDLNILMVISIYQMDKKNAVSRFVRIILFFACISLVFYFVSLIFGYGVFGDIFPHVSWGRGHYGYLFYSYTFDNRNCGIFYEPGVYQVLLTAALYCFVYFGERTQFSKNGQRIAVAILVLTIITSFSTTGFIALFIIICGLLLKRKTKGDKQILVLTLLSVIILMIEYFINGKTSLLQTHFINKFAEITDLQSSGGARLFVIRQTFEALQIDPFFGIGSKILELSINQKYYSGFGTGNVLFSMITTKGLVTVVITVGYIFKMAFNNKSSNSQFFIFICIFLNTVVAQTQIAYSALLLLAIIEPMNLKIEEKEKNNTNKYLKRNNKEGAEWIFQIE